MICRVRYELGIVDGWVEGVGEIMHAIEIRNQHSSLLSEIEQLLKCCRQMMTVATGGGHEALLNDTHDLVMECSQRIGDIGMRIEGPRGR